MTASDTMKIFGLWDSQDVEVDDISLKRYINLEERLLPHSSGRHEHKRFHKSYVHVVERLANKLMSPGRNTGKKILALNIVKTAMQIIELKTNKNPIQVVVDAIVNCAPREETTRISYGGIVYHTAVDSAPQRRVDVAIRLLANAVRRASFNNVRAVDEILAEQLILAGTNNTNSSAIKRKQDIERVALSAR
ncbi:MAG: 30S ribosomal protein S7 [Candidatus Heimdallarchaeota archaeon]|nr:30S ribosomal protein S7 [Candidatus Heimdallarchaeota archaeon]